MKKWEYDLYRLPADYRDYPEAIVGELDESGQDGWEAVCLIPNTGLILTKREIPESPAQRSDEEIAEMLRIAGSYPHQI